MRENFIKFIVTVCFLGKIKYAPGTFGSLAAFPFCYIIMHFTLNNKIVFYFSGYNFQEQQIITLFIIELLTALVLFIIGTFFTALYIKNSTDNDPKEVVIDELVGQMITIIFCSFSVILVYSSSLAQYFDPKYIDIIFFAILPFTLFRIFDVLKPWPINWLDKNIKGALGVMIDDIAASIFAIIVQYIITFFILDFYVR